MVSADGIELASGGYTQGIDGDVLRVEFNCFNQGLLPYFFGYAGEAGNQIKADIFKSGRLQVSDGLLCLLCSVSALGECEDGIVH